MKPNHPSLTAHEAAMMRAAHQIFDNPKVFEDQIALKIVNTQGDSEVHLEKRKYKTRLHSYLRAMSTPPGSEIIFDYVITPSSQNFFRRLVFGLLARRLARVGEPWVGFFDPDLLIMDLKTLGFTQVEDFGPEKINAKFFNDRTDRLMVGNFGHIMKAQL
jgi:O-methyltransferase involved in polyketide biosynthesis